ncbi:MAG TPA: ATP-dependent DNA helicase, partial [Rhodobacteraceae bacterium]|nr:ATP-dependent DNA helicase [Paracoccaceae bacterium]
QPGHEPVTGDEARAALGHLMADGASIRAGQGDYAAHIAHMFAPRDEGQSPQVVLAEAGTGLGKTLGYLAPAHLWARRNGGAVWISTYTRNLQRQIDSEAMRMDIGAARRHDKVVIRKGRENYLCLLNFEELAAGARGRSAVLAALVARWARFSRDGDMIGGDFPAWIAGLFRGNRALGDNGAHGAHGGAAMLGLTDRRGECIHSACPHYDKCFIERGVRKARNADIVIANHAFVMSHMALDQAIPGSGPAGKDAAKAGDIGLRLIFDEGHHVFDAADSAFSAHLSARETSELRRWLRGREVRGRRGRSLTERMGDLVEGDEVATAHLHDALEAARALPGPGWPSRLNDAGPRGAAERFFALVHAQVRARTGPQERFSLETETAPLIKGLGEAAAGLAAAITVMATSLKQLATCLRQRLDKEAEELDTNERTRLESAATGIERRALVLLPGWRDMLDALGGQTPAHFVDWFAIERHQGRDSDVGLHRHWIDPTKPFAATVLETAHGVALTSATLRDRPPQLADDWRSAELRTGAGHLPVPPRRFSHASPFDYARQARIIIINDLPRHDEQATAAALRVLFEAAGGGAMGLFTAIHRLRAAYERLAPAMAAQGRALYAQHVDPLDTGTLVDIFRAETDACLLGTDALRDGVDVPGRSLRLVVFDRVPWPRGSLLDKARRQAFGGNDWVDMMTRLKLQQAFGRLIRREDDRGVFVMLDRQLPTRLTTAFPADAPLQRTGLAEAVRQVRAFLNAGHEQGGAIRQSDDRRPC